jgi:hypothetical protein
MNINFREAVKSDHEALVQCHRLFMEHHIKVDKRFTLRQAQKKNGAIKSPNG